MNVPETEPSYGWETPIVDREQVPTDAYLVGFDLDALDKAVEDARVEAKIAEQRVKEADRRVDVLRMLRDQVVHAQMGATFNADAHHTLEQREHRYRMEPEAYRVKGPTGERSGWRSPDAL